MKRKRSGRRVRAIAAFLAAAIGMVGTANANDCVSAGAGAGGTCTAVTVTSLYIESGLPGTNGNLYLTISGAMTPLGCSLNGGYITLPHTAPTFSATYGALLAAQTTKAPFDLRVVQGDGGYCVVAYVLLH
jgi:hypothetical protein